MAISKTLNPAATHHLPSFITPPGETDTLMVVTAVFLLLVVLMIGNLYLQLHAFPEHRAHRTNKVQFEIVAVLALLALFTHNHLYWIAALLLAMVTFPDLSTPLSTIADSLRKIAGDGNGETKPEPTPESQPGHSPQHKA
jgi:hypothetical protein